MSNWRAMALGVLLTVALVVLLRWTGLGVPRRAEAVGGGELSASRSSPDRTAAGRERRAPGDGAGVARRVGAGARTVAAADEVRARADGDGIADQYVVRFASPAAAAACVRLARQYGVSVLGTIGRWNVVCLQAADAARLEALLAEVGGVVSREHNVRVRTPPTPRRESAAQVVDQEPFGASALRWLGGAGVSATSGAGVCVAVLDTGVQEHPTLAAVAVTHIDLVNADPAGEYAGHGTAVASILAGSGAGVTGVAPAVSLLDIRVMGGDGVGDGFTLAQGILEAVDQGAAVISLSLGSYADSTIVRDAVGYAQDHGALLVAASGNDGLSTVLYPAAYEGVIGVGGVDADGEHVCSSNQGDAVDVAAPGWGVTAAWGEGQTVSLSGTSVAVPFVTGAVASLLGADSSLTPEQAGELVVTLTNDAGYPGPDPALGQGTLSLGRIAARNEVGRLDLAVTSHWFDPDATTDGVLTVLVGVQNRGTMDAQGVCLTVRVDGDESCQEFACLPIGETASWPVQVPVGRLASAGSVQVRSAVSSASGEDAQPADNQRRSVLMTLPVSSAADQQDATP